MRPPTVRPFDGALLRGALCGTDIVLVEPYLEGTSSAVVSSVLLDVPHRLLANGERNVDHRRHGTIDDHDRAHELDAPSLRRRIELFLRGSAMRELPSGA